MTFIRTIKQSDLGTVLRLNQASIPAVSALTKSELRKLLGAAACARVIEQDHEPAGFLIGLEPGADYQSDNYQWFCGRYESFFYVDRIVIGAAHRGRGLGRALYDDVERWARARGLPRITCEVNVRPRNDESLAFHRAQGFDQVGTQETESGSKTVSLMARRIV